VPCLLTTHLSSCVGPEEGPYICVAPDPPPATAHPCSNENQASAPMRSFSMLPRHSAAPPPASPYPAGALLHQEPLEVDLPLDPSPVSCRLPCRTTPRRALDEHRPQAELGQPDGRWATANQAAMPFWPAREPDALPGRDRPPRPTGRVAAGLNFQNS
jgi:hypothetical protein